jgi:hypothetical protein
VQITGNGRNVGKKGLVLARKPTREVDRPVAFDHADERQSFKVDKAGDIARVVMSVRLQERRFVDAKRSDLFDPARIVHKRCPVVANC